MRLDINVFSDKTCSLYALDNTVYHESDVDDIVKHVFVEFMCYYPYNEDENTLLSLDKSKKITTFTDQSEPLDREYNYTLTKDGRYRYYKYGLYTVDHPGIYYDGTYHITNKVFYYNGNIYLGLSDITTLNFDNTNSKIITNWYTLREYFPTQIDFYFDKEIFTICNLNKCLIALEKEVLFAGLKNCSMGECDKNKQTKLQRNFIFTSVFVLDYLKDIGNYDEAQRILESLASCGSPCENTSSKNTCGCG